MKYSFSTVCLHWVFCFVFLGSTQLHAQKESSVLPDSVSEADRLYKLVDENQFDDRVLAMEYARKGLEVAQAAEHAPDEVRFLNSISQLYFMLGERPLALEYARRSEAAAQKMDSDWQLGNVYNAIGSIHFEQGDSLELALAYFEKSLAIRRKYKSEGAVAGSLNNIGRVLLEQGNYKKSRQYLDEALEINQRTGNWRWEVFNQMNFAMLAQKEGQYTAAREHSLEGIKLCDENIFESARINHMALLAETERLAGNKMQEIRWHQQIVESSSGPGMDSEIANSHLALSKLLMEQGESKAAYNNLLLYTQISDSLQSEERRAELANVDSRYEIYVANQQAEQTLKAEATEKENALQKARVTSWMYSLGALLFLAVALALYFAYRAKRIHNQKLRTEMELRNQQLQQTSEELNHFIYKSSHELHGPIKSIQGLLQLQRIDPDGTYTEMIQEKANQLEAEHSQLIHSMELKHREPQIQELNLGEEMMSCIAMLEGRLNQKINLNWKNGVQGKVYSDSWVLKTMVRPILEQAVLHHQKGSPLEVETTQEDLHLKVSMTANGAPEDSAYTSRIFKMFSGHGSQRSSLYNAKLAADQLGGKIDISIDQGKMRFTALVPMGEPA